MRWPEEDFNIFVEVGEMFGDGLCKMHASAMEHFSGTIKGSTEALKRNENAYLVRVEADGTMEWIAAEANSDATARRLEGMKRRFEENNPPFIEVPSRRIGEVKKIKSIKTKEKAPIAGSRFALLNSRAFKKPFSGSHWGASPRSPSGLRTSLCEEVSLRKSRRGMRPAPRFDAR